MNRLILISRMLFDVQISEAGKRAWTKKVQCGEHYRFLKQRML